MKVTVKDCRHEDRNLPWRVTYYVDRKPVRRYFKTEAEAKVYAAESREVLRSGADPATYALALRKVAGTGYSLLELVDLGLAYKQVSRSTGASLTATFGDGAKVFMANQVQNKDAPKTIHNTKLAYEGHLKIFENRIGTSITDKEVSEFLAKLPGRKCRQIPGKPPPKPTLAKPETQRKALDFIRGALRCIGIQNPLPTIPDPVSDYVEVAFFTVPEAWAMLTQIPEHMRGTVALALLAGLRPELLSKLPEAAINYKRRTIEITRNIAKDRKPHQLLGERRLSDGSIITGTPNLLWEWLEAFPYKRCSWSPIQRRLKKIIGRWVHDGCRHTAATYYYNIFGQSATAHLLTHEGERLVLEHYVGMTTSEDAEAFYNLKPANIPPIPPKNGVAWPTNDELQRMLQESPATTIAARLGCSSVALGKHCRKRCIPKPPRGYWAKVQHGKINRLTSTDHESTAA